MAYVGQEPTLFNATIYENIRHGLANLDLHESAEQIHDRVFTAAKQANAHDFISGLPDGYETEVGERGLSLSGGQRQRIAIARAIVSSPIILLLDEATSALDSRSERVVQASLDNAAKDRTTIVIAHRLSTIKNADNIVVMSDGEIVQQGTHELLMSQGGTYLNLVKKQLVDGITQDMNDSNSDSDVREVKVDLQTVTEIKVDLQATMGSEGMTTSSEFDNTLDLSPTYVSQSTQATQNKAVNPDPKPGFWLAIRVIYRLNRPESMYLLGGLIFSILAGFAVPM